MHLHDHAVVIDCDAEVPPGNTIAATYDAQDRLLTYGDESYTWSAGGDLARKTTSAGTTTFTYDGFGSLEKVVTPSATIEYVLDAAGRRVGRKVDGVLQQGWLYDTMSRVVAELDGTGAVISRFVYGSRPNSPDFMLRGGVSYRFVCDHRGSPRMVVDTATGTIAQYLQYDALGRVTGDSAPGFQPFGYAGGDTNLYGYSAGDPINWIDPTGLGKLPADPSGLSPEWHLDPRYKHPHGQRFLDGDGNSLEWHRAQPGKPRWRGKNHWHYTPEGEEHNEEHLTEGDAVPDPVPHEETSSSCSIAGNPNPVSQFLDEYGRPIAIGLGIAIIVGTIVEDVLTAGGGILDDPLTIGAGVALIKGATP